MFFAYIIESEVNGKFYIGQTENLEARLKRHNAGRNRSTKSGCLWRMKFWKEFQTRSEAIIAERKLKSLKKRDLVIRFVEENNYRGIAQSG
jgi:putative endonuclease